ncbi:MAG: hypothetical protein GX077_08885 [Tissierellia bacterium]|nr:hypothetical protein [Tissierellia bacterium]
MTDYRKKDGYPINISQENEIPLYETKKIDLDERDKEIKEEKAEKITETNKTVDIAKEKSDNQNKDAVIEILDSLKSIYQNYRKK